jgi:hypothetical protein
MLKKVNSQNQIFDHFMIPQQNFENFQDSLTENKIIKLYLKLKEHEKKGFVKYNKFLLCMKSIFDPDSLQDENKSEESNKSSIKTNKSSNSCDSENNFNKNSYYDEIFDLIFKRFREIKCIIKNNKNVFYLTDYKKENYINSYNLICALTIFLKTSFENKIKLLFNITDIDEDGYLNRYEIENMITSINHLFGEEVSTINTNSSILSQSLTNIKINNIIYELIYGQGHLYNKFIEEKNYINFETFYRGLKNIKNYKYRIIPCFINFRNCLFFQKREKMINVKEKNKKDFIKISSDLVLDQNKDFSNVNYKKFSINNLNEIIKPIRINALSTRRNKKNIKLSFNSPERFRKKAKAKNLYIKSDKSLKELIKTCTILNDDEKNDVGDKISNLKQSFKYAFQANFSDIRNIEVEPGIIKFLPNEIKSNNDDKINKMAPKTPDIRNNYKSIINKFKKSQLFMSLTKIKENKNEEEKQNKYDINLKKEKKVHIIRNKSDSSLLKNIVSRKIRKLTKSTVSKTQRPFKNNFNSEKYKTLDEIIKEINTQQKKFNYDSINYINSEIIKEYKKMNSEMNKFRKNSAIFNESNIQTNKFKFRHNFNSLENSFNIAKFKK